MKLRENIKRYALTAGVDEEDYQKSIPEIRESNRSIILVFSTVTFGMLLILTVLSMVVESLMVSHTLYLSFMIPMAFIAAMAVLLLKKHPRLTIYVMYAYLGLLLLFGILLGTVTTRNEISAAFIALLLTAPQMATDRPIRMYILIVASVIVFIVMVLTQKEPAIWSSDIVNGLCFGFVSGLVCTYTMSSKVRRYALERKIRYLAEMDQLTGMRNRNSYEVRLADLAANERRGVYCVYVDCNGMHELNNAQGHTAGDRMLQSVAEIMRNIFVGGDCYRIGGDEFVAIGVGLSESTAREKTAQMKREVEALGYHIGAGLSCSPAGKLDIRELIHMAEQTMYTDKWEYYKQAGIDRRHR